MYIFKKKVDYPMTDIHIHILPETDDGASDIQTTVQMLELAYEDGIKTLVCTPHYHPVKCKLPQAEIERRVKAIEHIANQLYPDLKLLPGREFFYSQDMVKNIKQRGMTINHSRYVLVEFDYSESRQVIRNGVVNILNEGLIPIISHIERYPSIILNEDMAVNLKEMGAVLQINADALVGEEGGDAKRLAKHLLKKKMVDVIATNAHTAGRRCPTMGDVVQWISNKYGYDYAKKIAKENPNRIIRDEFID